MELRLLVDNVLIDTLYFDAALTLFCGIVISARPLRNEFATIVFVSASVSSLLLLCWKCSLSLV
jgi:hypothetical protein